MVRIFKTVSNPIRLRILAMCLEREYTSRELREILGISKPLLIAHLKKLINTGLLEYNVVFDRERMIVRKYYRTNENIEICINKKILRNILKEENR